MDFILARAGKSCLRQRRRLTSFSPAECHATGVMEPVPDIPQDHAERPNESCLLYHAADAPIRTTDPKAVPHELEGRAQCLICHAPGAMEPVPDAPAHHEGIADTLCTLCHQPA